MTPSTMTAAARLAAKLLAHRQTSQEEVGDLIRHVHGALARLGETNDGAVPGAREVPEATPGPRKPRRVRSVARVAPPAALEEAPVPQEAPVPPPAPKLVRRAEVTPPPAAVVAPAPLAPPHGTLRGVVRWFDPKSGKGAVRLPGLGDVTFDSTLLAECGISRLFKGQEVEATIAETAAAPQLARLAIPGAVSVAPLGGGGVVKGRHAKPVVVELKREALRRAAARAEAEHVLGSTRTR